MTKLMRTLLLAIVIVGLVCLPLTAAAESRQRTVTVRDISVSYMDKTYDFGLVGSINANEDADQGKAAARYELSGESLIGAFQMAYEDDAMTLWADGLSNAYTLTLDDLMGMMELDGAPFDMEAYMGMVASYAKLLEDMSDPEIAAAYQAKMAEWAPEFFQHIVKVYPDPETIYLGGEDRTMQRARMTLYGWQIDEFVDKVAESIPGMAEFIDQYIAFAASIEPAIAAKLPVERPYTYHDLRVLSDVDMMMIIDMWADEAGNMRTMFDIVSATSLTGETRLMHIPMQIDAYMNGDAQVVDLSTNVDIDGQTIDMTFNISGSETTESFTMRMDIVSPYDDSGSVYITGNRTTPGDGTEQFGGALIFTSSDEHLWISLNYDGKQEGTEQNGRREGRVTISFVGPELPGADIAQGSVAFTLITEDAPYDPAAVDALKDLPSIPIVDMTEEQMAQLEREIKLIGIRAMGALLTTPGFAEFLSEQMPQTADFGFSFDMSVTPGSMDL